MVVTGLINQLGKTTVNSFGYKSTVESLLPVPGEIRRALFATALCVVIFTAAGGQISGPPAELRFPHFDKFVHVAVYGLLATAFARVRFDSRRPWRAVLFGTAAATLFGLADETRQYLNPHRLFEWADVVADFAGALTASLAYAHWPLYRRLLELSPSSSSSSSSF